MNNNVMRDVVFRTNGELFIGVVGPVRVGKSTFIRKFIETKVSPYINDESLMNKLIDDLPQSSEGKTIMTVEPKFVPSNPVYISCDGDINLNVRLVDCVGYIIPSAKGYENEDGSPRLVQTPWRVESIPFKEAAEMGTKKVIENHSHIGIMITSDGSITEFTREELIPIEEEIIGELKAIDKPFVIVLNSINPNDVNTLQIAQDLSSKYDVAVIPVDVANMSESEINLILEKALEEFDISKLDIKVPNWLKELDDKFYIKQEFNGILDEVTIDYRKFKHVNDIRSRLSESRIFDNVNIVNLDSGTGEVEIDLTCSDDLYNEVIESLIGDVLNDKSKFINFIQEAINNKTEYEQFETALKQVKATGYGIAVPRIEDMHLDTPEVIKQGSRYGVKLRAIAPSIHMIKIDVESTFEPIIGSEEQTKILIEKIVSDIEENPNDIWNSAIFGRKLSEVVSDGVKAKLYLLSEQTQYKFKESLEKVVNKGKGGILAIIL